MKKPYVQFSKRIVVAVTIAVTGISVMSCVLCWSSGEPSYLVDIVKAYIQYAMVVFAAYSGNSAVEKWLVKRAGNEEESDSDVG